MDDDAIRSVKNRNQHKALYKYMCRCRNEATTIVSSHRNKNVLSMPWNCFLRCFFFVILSFGIDAIAFKCQQNYYIIVTQTNASILFLFSILEWYKTVKFSCANQVMWYEIVTLKLSQHKKQQQRRKKKPTPHHVYVNLIRLYKNSRN